MLLHAGALDSVGAAGDEVMVGKYAGVDNPCMHHDQMCPHFASLSAGLVKNKFYDLSPKMSPSIAFSADAAPELLQLNKPGAGLLKKSCSIDHVERLGPGSLAGASIGM